MNHHSNSAFGLKAFQEGPQALRIWRMKGYTYLYTVHCTIVQPTANKRQWKMEKQMLTLLQWCTHFIAHFPNRRQMKGQQQSFSFILFLGKREIGKDRYIYVCIDWRLNIVQSQLIAIVMCIFLSLSLRTYSALKCERVFIYRTFVRCAFYSSTIYNVESTLWMSHLLFESKKKYSRRPKAHAFSELSFKFWIYIYYTLCPICITHNTHSRLENLKKIIGLPKIYVGMQHLSHSHWKLKWCTNRGRWRYELRWNVKWKSLIFLFPPTKEEDEKKNKLKENKKQEKIENLSRVSGEFQITFSLLIKCYRIISRVIVVFYASQISNIHFGIWNSELEVLKWIWFE